MDVDLYEPTGSTLGSVGTYVLDSTESADSSAMEVSITELIHKLAGRGCHL